MSASGTGYRWSAWLALSIALTGCGARGDAPAAAAAATLPAAASQAAAPRPGTFGAGASAALATLEGTVYQPPGRWQMCVPNDCGSAVRDWGADALTYTLFLRWKVARDVSIRPIMAALAKTAPGYHSCTSLSCASWSDIPLWDSVAAAREYEVTREPAALAKARLAFAAVDSSQSFAQGACPAIDYQRPRGGKTFLKTLETDSNYIKAALLLLRWTGDRRYLERARMKYAAVRAYFLDPVSPLYTAYVFDRGGHCRQLPHRYFASVNGNMIYNGLALAALTSEPAYERDALATARAVVRELSDPAGVYANLQADNDVAEPLIEAMYDLAAERKAAFAAHWLMANAAVAVPAASGAYGRFFDGPAPRGTVSAWSANGGFALAIAAGALAAERPFERDRWQHARFVAHRVAVTPATIAFTGRAIALIGTIGDACCEAGHVRVIIDGLETADQTGIWQNKSPAARALTNSILLSWRWPATGAHTIRLEPGLINAKEGPSYIRLQGYSYVP